MRNRITSNGISIVNTLIITHASGQEISKLEVEILFSINSYLITIHHMWKYKVRRGALGISVLRFWLFFRSVFQFLCQKTSVFWFLCSLRFADFSFFSIWFSVFVKKILVVFRFLVSGVVFGCSYFVLFGFRFLFNLSGIDLE